MIRFETLREEHRKDVIDIYNYYVAGTNYAYPDEIVDYSFFDRFLANARQLCGYAIRSDDGRIVGFCQLKPHNAFATFVGTVEITYFLKHDATRQGIGSLVLARLIEDARGFGKKHVLASISGDNVASLSFHRKNGFAECGRFRNIGFKLGKEFDIVFMQRDI